MIINGKNVIGIVRNGIESDACLLNGEQVQDPFLRGFVGNGSAYVTLDSAITMSGDFEFRAVINPTKASLSGTCILFGDSAGSSFLRITLGTKLQFQAALSYGDFTLSETIEDNIPIVLTVRRTGNRLNVFKNAKIILTNGVASTGNVVFDRLFFKGGATNYYWGQVADMRLYNASGVLINRWRFNETSGNTVVDSVGGINGTVTNPYAGMWTKTQIKSSVLAPYTPIKFLFASDMHMHPKLDAIEGEGGLTSTQRFDLFVSKVNEEQPTMVFIVGDTNFNDETLPLGNDQNPAVKAKLDTLTMPYKWIHGSHDYYNDEQWIALLGYPKNYSFTMGNVAFICVDNWGDYTTTTPGVGYGYKVIDQTWLTDELNKYTTSDHVFLVSHYLNPAVDTDTNALLATYPNYRGLFWGHIHTNDPQTVGGKTTNCDGHFSVTAGGAWNNAKPWGFQIMEINELGTYKKYHIYIAHEYPTLSQARVLYY